MRIQQLIYLLALLLMFSCSSPKGTMNSAGGNIKKIAIHNAISDFSTNCSLFKEDSVFSVNFKDSVFHEGTFIRVDERNYKDGRTHEWKRGTLYGGVVSVEINATLDYQFYYSEKTKEKLPSRYIIREGKLFFWWDDNYPVTEEIIAIFWKYNILQKYSIIPEYTIDDSKKGANYYFCKNDLSKYKRIITNIGIGYYKPPKLKCKNK